MRRKDREITDFDEMIKIIKKCDSCVLGLKDEDGYPYLIPMSFGLDVKDGQAYLYFHCAMQGKKLDLIRKDNRATFEMDCDHEFIMYDERMSCTMGYASVIGHGLFEFVPDEDKFNALKILMQQYHEEDFKFSIESMTRTTVLRLKITDMIGKRRNNIHPEEKVKRHITF